MGKRDSGTLRDAFQSLIGRDPNQQDYTDFIDPGTGRIWGGLYDNLNSEVLKRKGGAPSSSGGGSGGGSGGSGSGGISGPSPQSAGEQSSNLTSSYIENIDKIAESEFNSYSKFAPQYAEKQQQILNDLYPSQSGLGELLSNEISTRLKDQNYEPPQALKDQYTRARRGADSDRGLYRSGISGRAESEDLAKLGLTIRQNDINTALSLYSGVPKVQPLQSTPGAATAGQFTSLGFQGEQNDLNRSLQGSIANQNAQLSRYSTDVNAATQRAGFQSRFDSSVYGTNASLSQNQSSSANPWVTAAAEGLVNYGAPKVGDFIGNLFSKGGQ